MKIKFALIISYLLSVCIKPFAQDGCQDVLFFAEKNISTESIIEVLAHTIYHGQTTSENSMNAIGFNLNASETIDLIKNTFNITGENESEIVEGFRAWYKNQSFHQNYPLNYDHDALLEAIGVWKACRNLKKEQLEFSIQEAHKIITFTMLNSGEPVKFMGATYDKNELSCLLQSPKRKKAIHVTPNTRANLKTGLAYSIVCKRNQIENDSINFYPLTDISIATGKGSLTLKLPEKAFPSYMWLNDVTSEIDVLRAQIQKDIMEVKKSLKDELFTYKDILIGYYDSRLKPEGSANLKTNKILTNHLDMKAQVMWFTVKGNRAQVPNDKKYQIFLLSGANAQHVTKAIKNKKHNDVEINGYKGEQLVFIAFQKN